MRKRSLINFEFSEKLLYTSFLLLMGIGYLMAIAFLYTSHQGHDGKPGLSVSDVAETYYGNRSGTRLEAAIRGPMAGNLKSINDRHEIVSWLKNGALEEGYNAKIRPILAKTCLACHSPKSGLPIPDLSTYEGIQKVATVDTGASIITLLKLSHIHLFGIGLISLAIGLIFRFAVLPLWLKSTLIVIPFAAIFIDILAWFLTKWDPVYAYTVIIAGAFLGLSWAFQIIISLYQLWFAPKNKD